MLTLFLIGGVLLSARTSGEECASHHLQSCLDSIESMTQGENLVLVTTRHDLLDLCAALKENVSCVDEHMNNCFSTTHWLVSDPVVANSRQFLLVLCVPGPIQEAYLEHSPCYRNVTLSEDRCAPYYRHLVQVSNEMVDWRHFDYKLWEFCCAFNEILLCKFVHVNHDCGHEAAIFLQRHLDRISDPVIREHCAGYTVSCSSSSSASPTCSPSLHFLFKNAVFPSKAQWTAVMQMFKQFAKDLVLESIRELYISLFFL